jgi:hypothetical protein
MSFLNSLHPKSNFLAFVHFILTIAFFRYFFTRKFPFGITGHAEKTTSHHLIADLHAQPSTTLSMQHNFTSPVKILILFICITFGHAKAMQIFVNLPSNKILTLDVEPSDNIEAVKAKIQDKDGILPEDQYLYFTGNLLSEGQVLDYYNIKKENTLQAYTVGHLSATSFSSFPALLNLAIRDAAANNGRGWTVINYSGEADFTAMGIATQTISLRSFSGSEQGLIAGFDPSQSYEWNFLTAPGGVSGFNAGIFTVDTTEFSNAFTGTFSVVQSSAQSLAISYTAVPEPTTTMIGAIGLLALALRRDRA